MVLVELILRLHTGEGQMRVLNLTEIMHVSGGEHPSLNVTELGNLQDLGGYKPAGVIDIKVWEGTLEWRPENDWRQNLRELILLGGLLAMGMLIKRGLR